MCWLGDNGIEKVASYFEKIATTCTEAVSFDSCRVHISKKTQVLPVSFCLLMQDLDRNRKMEAVYKTTRYEEGLSPSWGREYLCA